MYVYQADTYCDDCGARICAELEAEGKAPDDPSDEWSYDSDEYPKSALEESTDGPDHCASGADCLGASVDLTEYGLEAGAELFGAEAPRIGELLSDSLTEYGVSYLREMLREAPRTAYQRALHRYWTETFSDELGAVDPPELDEALAAYVSCALWSSTDETGRPLDDVYGPDDVSDEARDEMRADLVDFLHLVEREGLELGELEPEQIGHDFWLTRNRHGAGFWDRGLGELGEALTKCAHSYGDSYVYVGDDGRLYVS